MSTTLVIYPEFLECQDFTLDQYWKDIFYMCACNKFPKGVSYDDQQRTIYIRIQTTGKPKRDITDLPQDSNEIFGVMTDLFRDKLGMRSPRDLCIQKEELEEARKSKEINLDCEWRKLKPRYQRDLMIMNYVIDLKGEYSLSHKEARQLLSTIKVGFQMKKLSPNDVDYIDRRIRGMKGLEYDKSIGEFIITNEANIVSKSDKGTPSKKFNQAIDRYIRKYNNEKFRL